MLDDYHSEIKEVKQQIAGQTFPRFFTILKKEREADEEEDEDEEDANRGQEKGDTKRRGILVMQ